MGARAVKCCSRDQGEGDELRAQVVQERANAESADTRRDLASAEMPQVIQQRNSGDPAEQLHLPHTSGEYKKKRIQVENYFIQRRTQEDSSFVKRCDNVPLFKGLREKVAYFSEEDLHRLHNIERSVMKDKMMDDPLIRFAVVAKQFPEMALKRYPSLAQKHDETGKKQRFLRVPCRNADEANKRTHQFVEGFCIELYTFLSGNFDGESRWKDFDKDLAWIIRRVFKEMDDTKILKGAVELRAQLNTFMYDLRKQDKNQRIDRVHKTLGELSRLSTGVAIGAFGTAALSGGIFASMQR